VAKHMFENDIYHHPTISFYQNQYDQRKNMAPCLG
jgi:hypothetical protein